MYKKMPSLNRFSLLCLVCVFGVAEPLVASAQMTPGSTKKSGSVEGSPLDTILSTRLWTTPPDAKDFVRETRPDANSLDYTPLHGEEPARPKPRDAANVKALQAELEHDIQMNEKRALALGGVTPAEGAAKPDGATKTGAPRHAKRSGAKRAAAAQ